jgi:transcriptional regulator with XRE-family HTH domain
MSTAAPAAGVGDLLREWRTRRRLSQLDLALDANISSRHLSFLETGRARPSREMVLHLCDTLQVPLRERNRLLLHAGYAPGFPERPLDDPALKAARDAVDLVLAGHAPYPALAVDRHWTLVTMNAAVPPLLAGVAPHLLSPPVNVLRVSLHPQGLASRIGNLAEWRGHLLARLRHQIDISADRVLVDLLAELAAYPAPRQSRPHEGRGGIVVPLELIAEHGTLQLFSTTTVFGTPIDVTLAELAIEALYPANTETAERLRAIAADSAVG